MDQGRSCRLRLQGRATLSQMHLQAHYQLLPQGIDGRVGDLSEALLEVVVEEMRTIRKNRQGDVIPHAVGGLLAKPCHVLDHKIEVLGRESHGGLQPEQIEFAEGTLLIPGLRRHGTSMLRKPVAVREAGGSILLDRPVIEQLTPLQIDSQHLPGSKPAFADNGLPGEINDARLRAHDHEAVRRGTPASRTQSIAIERGSDTLAIGEDQERRTVPGFLDAGVELVHRRHIRAILKFGLVAKCLRYQGDQAVGDRSTTPHHQFQGGVEVGGIAECFVHHRIEIASGITPDLLETGFRRLRPVEIAEERVDLSIVTEHPHRLSQRPSGQRVRAEATVIHRKTHFKARVTKIGVVAGEHLGPHHALVDNRATAERRHVEVPGCLKAPGMPRPGANPAAKTQQRSFEGISLLAATDEPLLDDWSGLACQGSQHIGIHGDHTPAFRGQTKAVGFLLTEAAGFIATLCLSRQKNHAKAAGDVGFRPDGFEVRPGNFTEHAGSISGVAIPSASTAVLHAAKPPQRLAQNPMAGFA